jgi:hypothetical protein
VWELAIKRTAIINFCAGKIGMSYPDEHAKSKAIEYKNRSNITNFHEARWSKFTDKLYIDLLDRQYGCSYYKNLVHKYEREEEFVTKY